MAERSENTGMTVSEAGRIGGQMIRDKYGSDYYRRIGAVGNKKYMESLGGQQGLTKKMTEIGKLGGEALKKEHGPEHFKSMGEKGGATTKEKYGREYFRKIGSLPRKGRNRFPTP